MGRSRDKSIDKKSSRHKSSRRSRDRSSNKDKRDKDSKKRSRSRSDRKHREKSRDRNGNRGRDREREKDRDRGGRDNKKGGGRDDFRFDSPPKDHELTKGIMAAAASIGGGTIANAQSILQSIHSMSMAQTAKIDRKLYVGNLPPGITQRMLIDVVNEAMLSLNVIEEPGNPVVSAWISSDSHYAFVEFRTAEEANHGFNLQGMNIQNNEIKIGRPKAYSGTMNAIGLMASAGGMNVQGGSFANAALMGMKGGTYHALDDNTTSGIQNPLMGGRMADEILVIEYPSRVLNIRNIASLESTKNEYNFCEFYSDIMDKCQAFGKVLELKIPRPVFIDRTEQNLKEDAERDQKEKELIEKEDQDSDLLTHKRKIEEKKRKALEPLEDPRNYDYPVGFGSAFAEFTSISEARRARRNIHLLRYGGKLVECEYHDEDKFTKDDFTRPENLKREVRAQEFEGLENCAIEFTEARPSEPMKI